MQHRVQVQHGPVRKEVVERSRSQNISVGGLPNYHPECGCFISIDIDIDMDISKQHNAVSRGKPT